MAQTFDAVTFMIDYEDGCLKRDDIVDGFQNLIDSGIVWQLQGFYGRMARNLIDDGYCHE